ncbi:MAG: cation:proton antiporter [Vicinamibacteria bacterium]
MLRPAAASSDRRPGKTSLDHHALILLFAQCGVMLLVAVVCGQVVRRFQQPAVLGELLGGILLGPTVFGTLAPGSFERLFPADKSLALARESLISVGMLFFLFVAGLEVKLSQLRRRGMPVALTSVLGLLVPMGLGIASVRFFPGVWGPLANHGGWAFSIFVGTALSISALPVIARILMDLQLIQRELGIVVMTAAALNDVIGWTLFAIILNVLIPAQAVAASARRETMLGDLGLLAGFAVVVLLAGRWLSRPALLWMRAHLSWPSAFIGITTVVMLGAAAVTESLGIHAVFGAYLAGIALGQTLEPGETNEAHDVIFQFAVSFFAPLYFVSIGLKANFARDFDLPLVLLVLVVACVGKVGGASLGAWLGGMRTREAFAVGFGMNARGAMEIILASVALESGLIDQRVFVALVVMALVTSALGGPAMKRLVRER